MATAWHHTDCNDLFLSSRKKLLQTLCSDLVINLCLPVTRYTDSSYGISSWCLWSYSVFPSQSTALWLVDKMKWNLQGCAGSSSMRTCSRLMGLNRGGVWCWSLSDLCVLLLMCLLSHDYWDKNNKYFGFKMYCLKQVRNNHSCWDTI